jgi:SnoaL-like domain
MMTTIAADVAAAYFRAWKAKDSHALRSVLAKEVTFDGPLASLRGADDVAVGLERLARITSDIIIRKRFIDDQDVLTWFELHTTIAPPVPVANWSHVEDGKITRIAVTFDPREIIAAGPQR